MIQDKPSLDILVSNGIVNEEALMHYGKGHLDGGNSGRYKWGSGKDPYQHSGDFTSRVEELRKQNFTFTDAEGNKYTGDTAIAKSMGLTTTQFRTQYSLAKNEQRAAEVTRAKTLRKEGKSLQEIANIMGYKNDSSIRSLLDENSEARMKAATATADFLKKVIDEKCKDGGVIDVGQGVDAQLRVSKEKLDQAIHILEMQGYVKVGGRVEQATNPDQKTTLKLIGPPGTPKKAAFDYEHIYSIEDYDSQDNGETFKKKFQYPTSIDSSRVKIVLKDEKSPIDGELGVMKDGLIQLRKGVPDLSLGNDKYAQVRILVDGDKYLKGMAIYSDNMPDGVDVVFNSNKTSVEKAYKDATKNLKKDPENPFGSAIKDMEHGGQYEYTDPETGEKKLGAINKRASEGDWSEWKDKIPSQFLSKQTLSLAKRQLGIAIDDKVSEYNDICNLTNPTVKKKLLESYASDCDSAAVHLQAAALPRQKYNVIIPLNCMNENEVYAPGYKNGEQVALIRYPHGGTFEIPILTVNNNKRAARNTLDPSITDAVGINHKVAERLSGADFDGDTVMVIPTNDKVRINSTKPLKGLEGFDPQTSYPTIEKDGKYYNSAGKEVKIMRNTQTEMGIISNLITDMTLKGATQDELARAVRHSMVVIDAEKHKLDYRQSYFDNQISELKKTYQEGGASTLISRAKSKQPVLKRQGSPKVNMKDSPDYDPDRPEGALIYKVADDVNYTVNKVNKRTGEVTTVTKQRTIDSTKMAETDDARTLLSKEATSMELLYANYANKMKSLANDARKEMMTTGKIAYSQEANVEYKKEVSELMVQLNNVSKNKPRERMANVMAAADLKARKQENPDMTKEEEKKIRQRSIKKYRDLTGASRNTININDRQWEAIQKGAISENTLKKILNNTDLDVIRQKATPRNTTTLSEAKRSRIRNLNANGKTNAEIAEALGVSVTTVSKTLKGE